jgi:hypothetical protein
MTARSSTLRSLATCLLALALPGLALAAPSGPREHPRGVFGQDELRRSVRQIENDWDLLVAAWEDGIEGLEGTEAEQRAVAEELLAIEDALDEARDLYTSRARAENVEEARALLERMTALEEPFLALEPPKALNEAWQQAAIDGRRLRHEAKVSAGDAKGSVLILPADDPVRASAAEVEDLSDNLKRLLLRTEGEASEYDAWIAKSGGGRDRHRVHRGRLERALLEFEVAADELKALYRKQARPRGVRPLLDRLARSARTIDYSMADASTDPEARREWDETLDPLRLLLNVYELKGIGVGWETHR